MKRDHSMTEKVRGYLRTRRATGVHLRIEGQQLLSFARFADHISPGAPLTVELALRWVAVSKRAGPVGRARRLEVVRPFARYLSAFEERTEIPAPRLLGPAHPRKAPCIYTDHQVSRLLSAAARMSPANGLRPLTLRTFFGLLACTGLRPSEALALTGDEVDLKAGILTIRRTKFRKSRLVPLHPSATRVLQRYARARDRRVPIAKTAAFFVLDTGVALTLRRAESAFGRLRRTLNWPIPANGRKPRIYDLRHTFACRRLQHWYADKIDVHNAIAALATYLGHTKLSDTYWYLTATPELMALTATRFEAFATRRIQ